MATKHQNHHSSKWPAWWFVTGAIVLLIEFTLKYLAWRHRYEATLIDIPGVVSFNVLYVENRHSAFSMMRSFPDWVGRSLLLVSIVFLIGLTVHQVRSPDSTEISRRGIFCFIVGAIGNLVDRALLSGAVVDYIDIRLGDDGSWYALAWNISDLVINLGFAHIMYEAVTGNADDVRAKKKNDGDITPEKEPRAGRVMTKSPPVSPRAVTSRSK
jgi:lipoprotein signal peptidase